ncbi:MAG: hypothetical protein KBD52_01380 [Candidatus Pacebacteria bacterium]|nr:hypothetical protein [Candidatus Paceibacterota bacterium]
MKRDRDERQSYGKRYLVEISKAVDWLEVYSPGSHRLVFIALKDMSDKELSQFKSEFLKKNDEGCYTNSIRHTDEDLTEIVRDSRTILHYNQIVSRAIAFAVAEVEVPTELFATSPKSKIGKMIWKWVNYFHSSPPRDECAFRRRAIFAFSTQLPILMIGRIFTTFWKIVTTLWMVGARSIVFFVGYRPYPIFQDVGQMWRSPFDLTFPTSFERSEIRECDQYKLLKGYSWSNEKEKRYLPISGIEIVAILFFGYALISFVNNFSWTFVNVFLFLIGAFILLRFLYSVILYSLKMNLRFRMWVEKRKDEKEAEKDRLRREKAREKKEDDPYRKWLLDNLSTGKVPARVNLDALPEAYGESKTFRTLRVRFFSTKAKICKPYVS